MIHVSFQARSLALAAALVAACGSPAAPSAPTSTAAPEIVAPPEPTVLEVPAPIASVVPAPEVPAIPDASGRVAVRGRVVDESGTPIAAATVAVSSEEYVRPPLTTDSNGDFATTVPATPALRLAASHPDYGEQWTDMHWQSWSRYDVITEAPVQLVLRRGVVLHGRLLDASGQPRAHERLLLVPWYRGSGPRPFETTTDGDGRFTFPRAALRDFDLVARSIDHWHPESEARAGDYLRIEQEPAAWVTRARADEDVEIVAQPLTLVPVTLTAHDASGAPAARADIDLWLRSGPTAYVGTVPRTDARGRVHAVMERGVAYDVWALPHDAARAMPWTESIPPTWHGSVDAAIEIPLTLP